VGPGGVVAETGVIDMRGVIDVSDVSDVGLPTENAALSGELSGSSL
jgi:hypothetical protein